MLRSLFSIAAVAVVLLGACTGPAAPGTATTVASTDLFPLEKGRSWRYRIVEGDRTYEFDYLVTGGDVRDLPDHENVPFRFVMGRPVGEDHDMAKSIFAMAPGAPRLFHLDALSWRLTHSPAIALLPPDVTAVGDVWNWSGSLRIDNRPERPCSAKARVARIESVEVPAGEFECRRVEYVYTPSIFVMTCWYAENVGLVRMDATCRPPDGQTQTVGMRLVSR